MSYRGLTLTLFCLTLCLAGCARATQPPPEPIPTPKSAKISEFIRQNDGDYAYSMLRPANWLAADEGTSRVYYPEPQDDRMRVTITAVNLKTYTAQKHIDTSDVRWTLYRQHPSLAGWTDALVQTLWKREMVDLEYNSANARVYSIRSISGHVRLVAYVVDQSTPLEIIMNVGGEHALMGQIYETGLMDDFVAMVESVRAEREQAGFSNPPFKAR